MASNRVFERSVDLIDLLIPDGGILVTFAAGVYVDESYGDDSPILCVAGYIFLKDEAMAFTEAMRSLLEPKGLPYFHMVDCAHGNGVFRGWTDDECDQVERAVIALVREHSEMGFSITIDTDAYDRSYRDLYQVSAYTFVLRSCLTCAGSWITDSGFSGDVAYFFEAGHASQSEANRVMSETIAHESVRDIYHYASHTFGEKRKYVPLQAGDLLAWQWFKFSKDRDTTRPVRKDCLALIRPQDKTLNWTGDRLHELKDFIDE